MNRLIIIGNGFDLAHGLKTGYNDFIKWYLKGCFQEAFDKNKYEDELTQITRKFWVPFKIHQIDNISDYIDFYYQRGFESLIRNRPIQIGSTEYKPYFSITVKSDFLELLLLKCSHANWVDIENEYYEQLKRVLNPPVTTRSDKAPLLTKLNHSLKELISLLEKYFRTLPQAPLIKGYVDIFEEEILKVDVVTVQLPRNYIPNTTHVLNFNYTSTIENYFIKKTDSFSNQKLDVNYIHGKLADIQNPLIFGFGDELDDNYLKMEQEKTKGFLEYIKSFWYFKTSNYHDLIRFIDIETFQVFILGHSCGLSDRTMLNMIFEHDNCKSIKIYYHEHNGRNNFTALTQEISKHFKNKAEMRKKIVPFDKSSPMSQIVDQS